MVKRILKRIKKTEWYKKDFLKNQEDLTHEDDTVILRRWLWRVFKDIVLMLAGIFSAAFGLESFLLPNGFIDGGATGIALLFAATTQIPLSLGILIINIPFVLLGYNIMGRRFAFKIALAILGLVFVISTVHFPVLTNDKLLVAVFGGLFLGAGIGLSIRGGAVLDGTEVLAIFLSRRFNTTIGDIIIAINVVIFCTAAYILSIETALYSMITYFAASRTLDFVIIGIEEYIGVTIISTHSEEIRVLITEELGRGVTVYKGQRGFGKKGHTEEMDILYSVITRLEISRLSDEIAKVDPDAFVVMSSIKDTKGGMVKKRPLH